MEILDYGDECPICNSHDIWREIIYDCTGEHTLRHCNKCNAVYDPDTWTAGGSEGRKTWEDIQEKIKIQRTLEKNGFDYFEKVDNQ